MKIQEKLNNGWFFKPDYCEEFLRKKDFSDFELVNIPHTVKEIPYDCFDDKTTWMVSTYAREIEIPKEKPERVFIVFDGVSLAFSLYVNGKQAGTHKGPYSIAFFEITEYVEPGRNILICVVDSNEDPNIPPNGEIIVDYLLYGGIYRDVKLYYQDACVIKNVKVGYDLEVKENGRCGDVILKPELYLNNASTEGTATIRVTVSGEESPVRCYERVITVPEGENSVVLEGELFRDIELWNPGKPALYEVEFSLSFENEEKKAEDSFRCRVGFRTLHVESKGFYVNGNKIKLIGTNRHQSYPYVGYALGKRAQEKDVDLLKEYGMNIIRCSHYMQSNYFLDRADEVGMLIFEEIPGWGSIGDEAYKQASLDNIENMVNSHFNHPSIIIWGTRLNETLDDDDFYTKTHELCKRLDPTRPTTGDRYHKHSNLIEDIYSFNDYPASGTKDGISTGRLTEPRIVTGRPEGAPYLVAEYIGADFPVRPWDHEERQEKHTLLGLNGLQDAMINDGYLGIMNWCAFDYNTHSDHSLHEKICYHGIFDMFRVPKMGAYAFKSQKDPSDEVVLEPCATVGRGERSNIAPFWVMTNCDYIDVKLSNDIVRRYYPAQEYAALAHPPILVSENGEFWQVPWAGSVIIGYIDGKEVIRREFPANPHLCLTVRADDRKLCNSEQDETRIECIYTDEKGNRMYNHNGAASIEVSGDIELIGSSIRSAAGGSLAFWVRTKATGICQKASVVIHTDRTDVKDQMVEISLYI